MVPSEGSGDPAHLQTPAPCLARAFAGRSAPDGEQRASVRLTEWSLARDVVLSGHMAGVTTAESPARGGPALRSQFGRSHPRILAGRERHRQGTWAELF